MICKIETKVNDNIEIGLSSGKMFVEIWQGSDLVECEYERIPAIIEALAKAYCKAKDSE